MILVGDVSFADPCVDGVHLLAIALCRFCVVVLDDVSFVPVIVVGRILEDDGFTFARYAKIVEGQLVFLDACN